MKKRGFALASALLLSFSLAQAETKPLVFAQGGMGTDGASLEPMPRETSAQDAEAIYDALTVKPDANGNKSVGEAIDGDVLGLQCKQPKSGIHTRTAGCSFITLLREAAPTEIDISVGSISFPSSVSDELMRSLNVPLETRRGSEAVKQVGNLKCVAAARPGTSALCTLSHVSITKMGVDKFPEEQGRLLRNLADRLGI